MQKEFSYPLKIDELGQGEQSYKLSADKDQRGWLAKILQVPAVNSFNADIKLKFQKKKGILEVSGKVEANLGLISVISLEEFDKQVAAADRISTEERPLHAINALVPILVTPTGMFISCRLSQP